MIKGSVLNGRCSLCKVVVGKGEVLEHLANCAEKEGFAGKGECFWLLVEGRHAPEYWLLVEVSLSAKLEDIDRFLRDIWLECCGHLSAFLIGGRTYISGEPEEADEEDMSARIDKILKNGASFGYEYDFGSTTELAIKVVNETKGVIGKKPVNLLARNEPPSLKCSCGSKAEHVCYECMNDDPKTAFLCNDCLEEHECGEEMTLPVVNSPRIGTCGYTGENI